MILEGSSQDYPGLVSVLRNHGDPFRPLPGSARGTPSQMAFYFMAYKWGWSWLLTGMILQSQLPHLLDISEISYCSFLGTPPAPWPCTRDPHTSTLGLGSSMGGGSRVRKGVPGISDDHGLKFKSFEMGEKSRGSHSEGSFRKVIWNMFPKCEPCLQTFLWRKIRAGFQFGEIYI